MGRLHFTQTEHTFHVCHHQVRFSHAFLPPPVVLKEDMLRPTLAQSRVRRVTVTEAFATKTSCQFITGGTIQFPQELNGFADFQELSRHISGFSRLTLAFAAAT